MPTRRNVDIGLLTAIGTVTLAFSRLDWAVSGFIWQLLSPDPQVGQTITANLTFRARLDLLGSLFGLLPGADVPDHVRNHPEHMLGRVLEAVPPERMATFRELMDRIGALSVRRDALHDSLSWLPGDGGAYELVQARAKLGKRLEWKRERITSESVTELAEGLFSAAQSLSQLMLAQFGFRNPPTTWPKAGHGTLYEKLLWGPPIEPERPLKRNET